MARAIDRLTALEVARKTAPGFYPDGGGLYLAVSKKGAKSWIFRYRFGGRRVPRDMGLGSARDVSLSDARVAAGKQRACLQAGRDPLEERARVERERVEAELRAQALTAARMTFDQAAEKYLAAHEHSWRNEKHRAQWKNTLRDYASPHMGALAVGDVDTRHVTAALSAIWQEKRETATRLRGRIESVLDFAKVQGWRSGENPARWRGHLDHVLPKRARANAVRHHPALPWQEIPEFMADLGRRKNTAASALRLTILCATRTGETVLARWPEIDLDQAVWTIPAERMKAHREHRIPLAPPAVEILRRACPASGPDDSLVFAGQRPGRPLSQMALLMLLRRMGREGVTVHGFRSTFRDWAGETTAHPREVVETALAHLVGDETERAYARGDLFEKRRRLMEDWAAYCATRLPIVGQSLI